MLSNGPLLAFHVDAVDVNAQWLFPLEQAPPPPRNKGYVHNGAGEPAPAMSNGSQPAPSPPMMSSPSLPSSTPTNAMTSSLQTTPSQGSSLNRADGVTSLVILTHHDALTKANTIALSQEILAQRAELAEHAQWVKAARSAGLAEWRCQEDAAQAKAFADKADMHRCHDVALLAIRQRAICILPTSRQWWHIMFVQKRART
jgi:hypothetical protein